MRISGINILNVFLAATILSACNSNSAKAGEEEKPNIIIFFTDDQGYGDVGCYGAEGFVTPYLDELAESGVRFTDFYVAASVCTPSRAALLTGKYPIRVGLHEAVLFPYSEHGLSPEEITLPELLKTEGYRTACIGKWHLGHKEEYMPDKHGFDYFYGVPYSNDMDNYFYKSLNFQAPPLPVYKNELMLEEGPNQDYLTRMWTDAAVDFINSNSKHPIFLYLAHNMPHTPWHASESFRGSSERGLYGDIIQELDWSMGEIIKVLNKNGIRENTIIIFTSDNGPVTRHENGGSAGPLRGAKASTWEGGMRVPGIISWPDKMPQGVTCNQPVSTLDLLPTLSAIAGVGIPDNLLIDGRDIRPIFFHPEKGIDLPFEFLYFGRDGNLEAMRQGEWKLHAIKTRGWLKENGEFPISLYNLRDDIGESVNVAEANPDIVIKMLKELELYESRLTESINNN